MACPFGDDISTGLPDLTDFASAFGAVLRKRPAVQIKIARTEP
jgi:hypothetical protein